MGNKSSIQSVSEVNSNHRLTEESKGNYWADAGGSSTHNGWGSSGASSGIKDQGWLDKPAEALHNGWGERITKSIGGKEKCCPSLKVRSNGWVDEAVPGEYQGWSSDPAKQEFNGWASEPVKDEYNGWMVPEPKHNATVGNQDIQTGVNSTGVNNSSLASPAPHMPEVVLHDDIRSLPMKRQSLYPYNSTVENQVNDPTEASQNEVNSHPYIHPVDTNPSFAPSAPPIPEEFLLEEVNSSPIELSTRTHETTTKSGSSSCIICWESPVEGACVPCGHMVGCMSCLNEIKSKKGDCPICRSKIDQVVKLYAV
ncbi:hypothetical protein LIER_28402 [Lithospermum erythrorhizon]|uniref:RING-type domain-containing protein n=1 Tax=Lithospermum erythrorhizon TaxID=34254 RepID=A0AAV3RFJ6_LITER